MDISRNNSDLVELGEFLSDEIKDKLLICQLALRLGNRYVIEEHFDELQALKDRLEEVKDLLMDDFRVTLWNEGISIH